MVKQAVQKLIDSESTRVSFETYVASRTHSKLSLCFNGLSFYKNVHVTGPVRGSTVTGRVRESMLRAGMGTCATGQDGENIPPVQASNSDVL